MPVTTAELELRDIPRTPSEVTLRRGARLVSPKVGLVQSIGRGVYRAQDPAIVSLGGTSGDLSRCSSIGRSPDSGSAATTLEAALAAVVGESVERYAMLHHDRRDMVLARWSEVADNAVHPDRARLYARHQVGSGSSAPHLGYFDEQTPTRWVWAHSLGRRGGRRRRRLVPASLVYLDYRPAPDDRFEVDIGRNSSGGLAAGATLEEALLSGLLEVVERDAFTLTWFHRRIPRQIRIPDGDPLAPMLRRRFHAEHPNVDLRCFELALELGIPVMMALLRRPSDFGPALCVGAAARLDPRAALAKALIEAGQEFPFLRYLLQSHADFEPAEDYSNLTDFDRHCLLYVKRPELVAPAFDFLDRAPVTGLETLEDRSTGRVLGDLESIVERLEACGFEALAVDITPGDVRDAGLVVVRVLVPGLAQLHGDHTLPFLGVERLHRLPEQLDWAGQGWNPESSPNPFPHPFP